MNKIFFITGNENKLREAKEILGDRIESLNINLIEIQSSDPHEIIKHKLEEAKEKYGGCFVVEDTSLYLEGMNGLPGPLIKWFLKTIGNSGLTKLTSLYGEKAIAKCIVGYFDGEKTLFFEGTITGKIVESNGTNGFGWDKIFQPEGYEKTFAEMNADEKNSMSHRRKAFEKLKKYLDER